MNSESHVARIKHSTYISLREKYDKIKREDVPSNTVLRHTTQQERAESREMNQQ